MKLALSHLCATVLGACVVLSVFPLRTITLPQNSAAPSAQTKAAKSSPTPVVTASSWQKRISRINHMNAAQQQQLCVDWSHYLSLPHGALLNLLNSPRDKATKLTMLWMLSEASNVTNATGTLVRNITLGDPDKKDPFAIYTIGHTDRPLTMKSGATNMQVGALTIKVNYPCADALIQKGQSASLPIVNALRWGDDEREQKLLLCVLRSVDGLKLAQWRLNRVLYQETSAPSQACLEKALRDLPRVPDHSAHSGSALDPDLTNINQWYALDN